MLSSFRKRLNTVRGAFFSTTATPDPKFLAMIVEAEQKEKSQQAGFSSQDASLTRDFHRPQTSEDFLVSTDLISEGPIEGLVNEKGQLIQGTGAVLAQGIYLDGERVIDTVVYNSGENRFRSAADTELTLTRDVLETYFNYSNLSFEFDDGEENKQFTYNDSIFERAIGKEVKGKYDISDGEDDAFYLSASLGSVDYGTWKANLSQSRDAVDAVIHIQNSNVDQVRIVITVMELYLRWPIDAYLIDRTTRKVGQRSALPLRYYADLVDEETGEIYSSLIQYMFMLVTSPVRVEGVRFAIPKEIKGRPLKIVVRSFYEDTESSIRARKFMVHSIKEIIKENFNYPHSALIQTSISAKAFERPPTRTFDLKLKKVKIPSNYFPSTDGIDRRFIEDAEDEGNRIYKFSSSDILLSNGSISPAGRENFSVSFNAALASMDTSSQGLSGQYFFQRIGEYGRKFYCYNQSNHIRVAIEESNNTLTEVSGDISLIQSNQNFNVEIEVSTDTLSLNIYTGSNAKNQLEQDIFESGKVNLIDNTVTTRAPIDFDYGLVLGSDKNHLNKMPPNSIISDFKIIVNNELKHFIAGQVQGTDSNFSFPHLSDLQGGCRFYIYETGINGSSVSYTPRLADAIFVPHEKVEYASGQYEIQNVLMNTYTLDSISSFDFNDGKDLISAGGASYYRSGDLRESSIISVADKSIDSKIIEGTDTVGAVLQRDNYSRSFFQPIDYASTFYFTYPFTYSTVGNLEIAFRANSITIDYANFSMINSTIVYSENFGGSKPTEVSFESVLNDPDLSRYEVERAYYQRLYFPQQPANRRGFSTAYALATALGNTGGPFNTTGHLFDEVFNNHGHIMSPVLDYYESGVGIAFYRRNPDLHHSTVNYLRLTGDWADRFYPSSWQLIEFPTGYVTGSGASEFALINERYEDFQISLIHDSGNKPCIGFNGNQVTYGSGSNFPFGRGSGETPFSIGGHYYGFLKFTGDDITNHNEWFLEKFGHDQPYDETQIKLGYNKIVETSMDFDSSGNFYWVANSGNIYKDYLSSTGFELSGVGSALSGIFPVGAAEDTGTFDGVYRKTNRVSHENVFIWEQVDNPNHVFEYGRLRDASLAGYGGWSLIRTDASNNHIAYEGRLGDGPSSDAAPFDSPPFEPYKYIHANTGVSPEFLYSGAFINKQYDDGVEMEVNLLRNIEFAWGRERIYIKAGERNGKPRWKEVEENQPFTQESSKKWEVSYNDVSGRWEFRAYESFNESMFGSLIPISSGFVGGYQNYTGDDWWYRRNRRGGRYQASAEEPQKNWTSTWSYFRPNGFNFFTAYRRPAEIENYNILYKKTGWVDGFDNALMFNENRQGHTKNYRSSLGPKLRIKDDKIHIVVGSPKIIEFRQTGSDPFSNAYSDFNFSGNGGNIRNFGMLVYGNNAEAETLDFNFVNGHILVGWSQNSVERYSTDGEYNNMGEVWTNMTPRTNANLPPSGETIAGIFRSPFANGFLWPDDGNDLTDAYNSGIYSHGAVAVGSTSNEASITPSYAGYDDDIIAGNFLATHYAYGLNPDYSNSIVGGSNPFAAFVAYTKQNAQPKPVVLNRPERKYLNKTSFSFFNDTGQLFSNDIGKKIYIGDWDGTFKVGWTDNPAWIIYDMITNPVYGLSNSLEEIEDVNVFDLYSIGRYCDAVDESGVFIGLSDGKGGLEPRYSFNYIFANKANAFEMINSVAASFHGVAFWQNGQINFYADKPEEPIMVYNNGNVLDGIFEYADIARNERFSMVSVPFADKNDDFRIKKEYVENEQRIRSNGIIVREESPRGASSRSQARRYGKHILYSNLLETESVVFKTDKSTLFARPGEVIQINDELKSFEIDYAAVLEIDINLSKLSIENVINTGSIITGSEGGVSLNIASGQSGISDFFERDIFLGGKIDQNLLEKTTQNAIKLPITGITKTGNSIELFLDQNHQSIFGLSLVPTGSFANIDLQNSSGELFRIRNISEEENNLYTVLATKYDPSKYELIEREEEYDVNINKTKYNVGIPSIQINRPPEPDGFTFSTGMTEVGNIDLNGVITGQIGGSETEYRVGLIEPNGSYKTKIVEKGTGVSLGGNPLTNFDFKDLVAVGSYTITATSLRNPESSKVLRKEFSINVEDYYEKQEELFLTKETDLLVPKITGVDLLSNDALMYFSIQVSGHTDLQYIDVYTGQSHEACTGASEAVASFNIKNIKNPTNVTIYDFYLKNYSGENLFYGFKATNKNKEGGFYGEPFSGEMRLPNVARKKFPNIINDVVMAQSNDTGLNLDFVSPECEIISIPSGKYLFEFESVGVSDFNSLNFTIGDELFNIQSSGSGRRFNKKIFLNPTLQENLVNWSCETGAMNGFLLSIKSIYEI